VIEKGAAWSESQAMSDADEAGPPFAPQIVMLPI